MIRFSKRWSLLYLLCLLLSTVGCSDGGPPTATVEGTVKLNGKAMNTVMVEFWPDDGGTKSMAETDADGKFKLMMENGKSGAVVGSHRVVLRDTAALGDKFLGREGETVDLTQGKKARFSAKFGTLETTPVKFKVEAGKANQADLEVTVN
jgi:hypothetical protein